MNPKSSSLPMRVGVIGCGNISNAYFGGTKPFSDVVKITACADIDLGRAKAKGAEHGVAKACSVEELLADPEIDTVLNLTIPKAHAEINLAAVKAGKNAYCEKPFSLNSAEGLEVVNEAKKRGLRVGCAPDTVLGGGIQTCRRLIDEGAIGTPLGATANMLGHGHEHWHPAPDFYYQAGGGPLFDMGPYYLTALVTMIGPVKSVTAKTRTTFAERMITSQPFHGKKVKVEVPTHLIGLLEFDQGAVATVTMSFDVWAHNTPQLEIYGTEGSLSCPDPNCHGGDVKLWTTKTGQWEPIALDFIGNINRGFGLADLAYAIKNETIHRMNGDLGLHVVEVMEAFQVSSEAHREVRIEHACAQPEAVPIKLPFGEQFAG